VGRPSVISARTGSSDIALAGMKRDSLDQVKR
jgi:hypothetical protein